MTLRIVEMLRKGELHPAVAVQILGQLPDAVASEMDGGAPKRKREPDDDYDGQEDDDVSDDLQPVEEILRQAKQAKKETYLKFSSFFSAVSDVVNVFFYSFVVKHALHLEVAT